MLWRRFLSVPAIGLALSFPAPAQQPPSLPVPGKAPIPAPAPSPFAIDADNVVTRYTLGEALAIGHDRHPQLAALKSSMNAALIKQRGLDEVKRTMGIFAPDIDYRQRQSDLGLRAAMAEYEQAKHEVTFAVVRCYYTVVYAREQTRVARDLVDQFEDNLARLKKIVQNKEGPKGLTQMTVDNFMVALGEARGRLIHAESGVELGRAALREAMGLEPGSRVDSADEVLPDFNVSMKREIIIAHAVTRRGEVHLAQMGAEATQLEVCAQWARKFTLMGTTYSNAADIHARPIHTSQRDPDYKPGAIGPEMPDRLLGRQETRADTAKQYANRAKAAADQARSLIGLEAEVAYTRWTAAVEKVKASRESAEAGKRSIKRLREAAGAVITKEEVLLSELAAARAQASLNEALYDQIVAMANIERITAGGVRVNYHGR